MCDICMISYTHAMYISSWFLLELSKNVRFPKFYIKERVEHLFLLGESSRVFAFSTFPSYFCFFLEKGAACIRCKFLI